MYEARADGATLRYAILGTVRAWDGPRELDLGPSKQRAVLAVLLLQANQAVQTTQIVDAVWGDSPPANGANVVQKYVAGLRQVLEPHRSPRSPGELLTRTDGGYRLRVAQGALDTHEFERWVATGRTARDAGRLADAATAFGSALSLARTDTLVGLVGPYFDAARDRLADARGAAHENWAEVELERGYHGQVASELSRLVGQFPLRERLRALLMLALYRCGRQAEALEVYRSARTFLIEEFGVEPGEHLQEMQQRILRSDPALAPPGRSLANSAARTGGPAAPANDRQVAAPDLPPAPPPPAPQVPPTVPARGPGGAAPREYVRPELPTLLRAALPTPRRLWIETGGALLVTAVSFGFLGWAMIAYFAIRRRSIAQLCLASVYLMAIMVGLAASDSEALFGTMLFLVFLIGPAHLIVYCLYLHARTTEHAARGAVAEFETALRRSLAQEVLDRHPALARDLRIGRPDLPDRFDDGGLVDINAVPVYVLAALPGVGTTLAARIVDDRTSRGSFTTPYDLVHRGHLPVTVVRDLEQVLIARPTGG